MMDFRQAVREALISLMANKLRSGLTTLGIVIGVAAVIAMLAVGTGAQDSILGSIGGLGTNLLFIFPGNTQVDVRNPRPLTVEDMIALSDPFAAPDIERVAAAVRGQVNVSAAGETVLAALSGVTPEYFVVRNYKVIEGQPINEEHMLGRASVALLGPEVAEKLFGRTEGLVGAVVRIDRQPFRVIGVLERKGGSAVGSQDNSVVVPLTTAQARLLSRKQEVDILFVQAVSADRVPAASEEAAAILRQRHRTAIGADDFTIFSQQDFLSTAETITRVLTIFLGGIAAISLLVGGIGIMNIMLVSVTERTREIGLRKALGARKRDILIQFLTESSLLSLIGGVIGIFLGWLISFAVGRIAAASNADLTPRVGLDAVLLATLFSAAVGLFFGIYPASRAANLEPVEALRYE